MSYDFITLFQDRYEIGSNVPATVTQAALRPFSDIQPDRPLNQMPGEAFVLGVVNKLPHYLLVFDIQSMKLKCFDLRAMQFTNREPEFLKKADIPPFPYKHETLTDIRPWFEQIEKLFNLELYQDEWYPPVPFTWSVPWKDWYTVNTLKEYFSNKVHLIKDGEGVITIIPKPSQQQVDELIEKGIDLWKDDIKAFRMPKFVEG